VAIEQNIGPAADYFTGEDKTLPFTIYQSDESTPQDITGWSLSWMVKRRKTDADADAIVTKTVSAGIALTTPLSGVCTVTVTDTDIADIRGGVLYYHELKRTDAGFETVLSYGTLTLAHAVHA
jgi:hypothetical protein